MNALRPERIYSALLHFYPRNFRDEYGSDMALLFAQQVRDEGAGRAWTRSVVDLAITIPTQHLEAHMNRPPNSTVPVAFACAGISGLALAVVGGSNLAMLAFGLTVGVVAGAIAIVSWRRTREIAPARSTTDRWWQLLLAGVTVLATTLIVINVVGEVSSVLWLPMMIALFTGVTMSAAGLILGAVHRVEKHPRSVAG